MDSSDENRYKVGTKGKAVVTEQRQSSISYTK